MAFLLPWLPFLSPSGSPLPITYICLGRLAVKVPRDNLLLLVVPVPNRVLSRNREKRSREAWGSGKRYLSLSLQASLGRFSRLRNETQTRGASTERTSCSLALVMSLAEFLKLLSIISTMLNREPMKGRRRLPRERHKTIDLMSRNNDSARPARAFQISIHFFVVFVTQFIGRVRQRHVTQS